MILYTYFPSGLARKEDFPYVTYYCPHCHALNQPKQLDACISAPTSPNMGSPKTDDNEAVKKASASAAESILTSDSPVNASASATESIITSKSPVNASASATESTITSDSSVNASPEIEEVSERASLEDKAD